MLVGIISKESEFHPLGEAWTSDGNFKKSITNQYKNRLNEHFKHAEILLNPYFMVNCITLTIVTVLEGSITMKLSELIMVKKINKQLEFVGLALSNFLSGVFGILPMSIPIGRNLLALRSGASHRAYLLLAAFLVVLFGFIIWPFMKSLPMITVSVFNASLGVLLIDTELFYNYWRFSPKYAVVFTLVIISSFFLDLTFSMIFSWIMFLVIYMQTPSDESYEIGDLVELQNAINIYMISNKASRLHNSLLTQSGTSKDEEGDSLLASEDPKEKATKVKTLLTSFAQRSVIYKLRGRFNFLFYKTHLANLRHLDKKVVILDFSQVILNDIEFIGEYSKFISELIQNGNEVYVTGISELSVHEDLFYRGSWVQELNSSGKILFKS